MFDGLGGEGPLWQAGAEEDSRDVTDVRGISLFPYSTDAPSAAASAIPPISSLLAESSIAFIKTRGFAGSYH